MTPYPGYNPSFKTVDTTKGQHRTCLVIELLSNDKLSDTQIALIQEHLEALLHSTKIKLVDQFDQISVIPPGRFDTLLRQGLRLS